MHSINNQEECRMVGLKYIIQNLKLRTKYKSKMARIIANVYIAHPELKNDYIFIYCSEDYSLIPTSDIEYKAWCNPLNKKIYISECVLRQTDNVIEKVLVHEMLHCQHPKASEIEIIEMIKNVYE